MINPADESVVGTAADADADDAYDAVTAARKAAGETDWATNHEFRLAAFGSSRTYCEGGRPDPRAASDEGIVPAVASATLIEAMIEGMDYFNGLISTWEWEKDLGPTHFPAWGFRATGWSLESPMASWPPSRRGMPRS